MRRELLGAGALVLALTMASTTVDAAAFKTTAMPGTRHYRYISSEQTQGQPATRYRVDFDLKTGADSSVVAIIRKAEMAKGDNWSTPQVDAACKRALHGDAHALARVTLNPVTPEVAKSLGEPFMAMCAPPSYFFPMTDILNVSLVQTSPRFHIGDLAAAGMSGRFDGFATKLDRLGVAVDAASPGGLITLSALDAHTATIDWAPDPMQLTIVHHAQPPNTPEVTLAGTEHYAFRVEIDAETGVLRHAATTADNLDLAVTMPGLPPDKAPHIAITREVTIETRD